MNNILSLDNKYSTTRLLMKERSEVINITKDKFKTYQGGLRTKGYIKNLYENKPLITIVTVVYNGESFIEETIQTVINQTYNNVEYIIIDGASTDGTLDIIKKYDDKIDYWVSEEDYGIYDAMNKGIDVATGEWINFMNAGDGFYNDDILEKIFTFNKFKNVDVIYGNHNVIYSNKSKIVKAGKIVDIWKGSQFCHQSTFISSKVHKMNKYNISNIISADFELFYNLYKKNKRFIYIDVVIVNYLAGGLSDIKRVNSILGWWKVVDKSFLVNTYYFYKIINEILKKGLKFVLRIK